MKIEVCIYKDDFMVSVPLDQIQDFVDKYVRIGEVLECAISTSTNIAEILLADLSEISDHNYEDLLYNILDIDSKNFSLVNVFEKTGGKNWLDFLDIINEKFKYIVRDKEGELVWRETEFRKIVNDIIDLAGHSYREKKASLIRALFYYVSNRPDSDMAEKVLDFLRLEVRELKNKTGEDFFDGAETILTSLRFATGSILGAYWNEIIMTESKDGIVDIYIDRLLHCTKEDNAKLYLYLSRLFLLLSRWKAKYMEYEKEITKILRLNVLPAKPDTLFWEIDILEQIINIYILLGAFRDILEEIDTEEKYTNIRPRLVNTINENIEKYKQWELHDFGAEKRKEFWDRIGFLEDLVKKINYTNEN
jgi:hypothetical protein